MPPTLLIWHGEGNGGCSLLELERLLRQATDLVTRLESAERIVHDDTSPRAYAWRQIADWFQGLSDKLAHGNITQDELARYGQEMMYAAQIIGKASRLVGALARSRSAEMFSLT